MYAVQNNKKYKIAIKICAPNSKVAIYSGDYLLALCLKQEFEKKGNPTIIQCLNEWNDGKDSNCDTVIFLRGLRAYQPKKHHVNILWNISHPDNVPINEYNKYHFVLISSIKWAEIIKPKVKVPVEPMLQCTDLNMFKPFQDESFRKELLFVGNSRGIYRKIIKDLLPTTRQLSVYGKNWGRLIDKRYIKGQNIPYSELHKYYGSCDILLNDHWDDMRKKGFINNRIFDGLASEAFIISDHVSGIEDVFGQSVVTYNSPKELRELIDYYLAHPELRRQKAREGAIIVQEHTYAKRVERLLEIIDHLHFRKKITSKDPRNSPAFLKKNTTRSKPAPKNNPKTKQSSGKPIRRVNSRHWTM
ncbi:glycosyltransferase [Ammoniphilus sp. 3BR4]|uniref:CgeB family protein n=1 Tax=Ammoniphilus sp. 3BR4 TaxID=3158265 RepID=UPI0034655631